MDTELIALCIFSFIGFTIVIHHGRTHRIRRVFAVPWYCFLLGADIGGSNHSKITFRAQGLIGSPDAIFFDPLHWRWVVCELKSRPFTGRCFLKERYQIQLYLHLSRRFWAPSTCGRLAYTGGVLKVHYEPKICQELLKLRNEAIHVSSQYQRVNDLPLHRRVSIESANYPIIPLK